MKPTRRNFIKTIAIGIIGNGILSGLPIAGFTKTENYDDGIEIQKGFKVFDSVTQKSMVALAETLVPGSKKLGIRQNFMKSMAQDLGSAGFFDAGFWNLDALSKHQFKKPFYALEKREDKNEIIKHISAHNRVFFQRFRETVIKFYYSNPTVWQKLSYTGPPQPKGFMDYSLPPKGAS